LQSTFFFFFGLFYDLTCTSSYEVGVVLDPSEVYSHIVGRCFNRKERELQWI